MAAFRPPNWRSGCPQWVACWCSFCSGGRQQCGTDLPLTTQRLQCEDLPSLGVVSSRAASGHFESLVTGSFTASPPAVPAPGAWGYRQSVTPACGHSWPSGGWTTFVVAGTRSNVSKDVMNRSF